MMIMMMMRRRIRRRRRGRRRMTYDNYHFISFNIYIQYYTCNYFRWQWESVLVS